MQLSVKHSENRARESAEWNGRFRTPLLGGNDALEGVGSVSSSVSPASNTTAGVPGPEPKAALLVAEERSWRSW